MFRKIYMLVGYWIIYSFDYDVYLCVVRVDGFYHCVGVALSESDCIGVHLDYQYQRPESYRMNEAQLKGWIE